MRLIKFFIDNFFISSDYFQFVTDDFRSFIDNFLKFFRKVKILKLLFLFSIFNIEEFCYYVFFIFILYFTITMLWLI